MTNLQRQIAHDLASVGTAKAASAARSIAAINPDVRVIALQERADAQRLGLLAGAADVVIDCSDNFATRHAVNAACVAHAKPLVSGAAIGFDGQISVYDTRRADAPCYACVFPPDSVLEEARLRDDGRVRAARRHHRQHAGGRGAQARDGCRHVARRAPADARRALDEWTEIAVKRNPACLVCAPRRR